MTDERIIELAAAAGAKAAIEEWGKQQQDKKREEKNTRLWNTRMLLRHYKSLNEYCENAGGRVNFQQVIFRVTTDEKNRTCFEASVDIPKLDEQQALLYVEELLNE